MVEHHSTPLPSAKSVPKFTDLFVQSVPFSPETATVWDASLKGFGLRIGKNSKTFIALIASGRRQKIGRYPTVSLSQARTEAKRILAEKQLGKIKPTYQAYDDAKDEYLAECKAKNRASTYRGYKWRLDGRFPFGRRNLADITARDILAKLKPLPPMEKRYAFVVARAFFRWCVAQHYLDLSPMHRLEAPPKGDSRERILTPEELKAVWHACPDDPYGTTVKILILTGQRRGEPEHMSLDGDLVTIPGEHTKNHQTHVFPVGPLAQALLVKERKWGGWGKSKAKLDRASKTSGWSIHDLRRTWSSTAASLGVQPHIVEAYINHKTGTISGVAAIYNRHKYIPEMRECALLMENHLSQLLNSA